MSSGLGGGAVSVYTVLSDTGDVKVIDFRERAPKNATRDMYLVDGEVQYESSKCERGLAVGVPGEPGGLWALQRIHGDVQWKDVVQPAYALAHDGFSVGEALAKRLQSKSEDLDARPPLASVFKKDGEWVKRGDASPPEAG